MKRRSLVFANETTLHNKPIIEIINCSSAEGLHQLAKPILLFFFLQQDKNMYNKQKGYTIKVLVYKERCFYKRS